MSYVRARRRGVRGFGDGPCPAGQVWNFASGQCEPDPAANAGGNITYCLQHPEDPGCSTPGPTGGGGPSIPLPGKTCPAGTASGPDGSCTPITPAAIAAACAKIGGWLDRYGSCYAGPAPAPDRCGKGAFPVADKMNPAVLGCECEYPLMPHPGGGNDCVTAEQYCAHWGEDYDAQQNACVCKSGYDRPAPGQDCRKRVVPPPAERKCPAGTTGTYPNCVAPPAPTPAPAGPNRAFVVAAVGGLAMLAIAGAAMLNDPKKKRKGGDKTRAPDGI